MRSEKEADCQNEPAYSEDERSELLPVAVPVKNVVLSTHDVRCDELDELSPVHALAPPAAKLCHVRGILA